MGDSKRNNIYVKRYGTGLDFFLMHGHLSNRISFSEKVLKK